MDYGHLSSQEDDCGNMKALWRFLQFFGAAGLITVALTHVAETLHLFPGMGWGQPDSAGHYLDLVSAILGCALHPLGFVASVIQRKHSN